MTLSSGTRLGPYEIIALVGSGGMGTVYKARDTRLNRTVAIKLLGEKLLHDAELRHRFDREANAIASLTHPHICVLHDVGDHEGERYLVMEYLEGGTLADRLTHGQVPLQETLRYAKEMAGALAAAHRSGILHRDLKPSNVILTKSGAKLLDFGLAKHREPSGGDPAQSEELTSLASTVPGAIVGTLAYMAPERIEGKPADARSDIFAFGAVLYEMLSGHPAFQADSKGGIVGAIFKAEPPPLRNVPVALDRLIRRCLEKDPDDRWQSAQDLVEGLNLIAETGASSPIAARVEPRRRWLQIALLTALVGVAAAASWYVRSLVTNPLPVVVLMDSTLPERVYDPDTREKGGTNSDDINDTLRDLPLEIHKETTSALWHREDQVMRQRPALVMMHLSSFAKSTTDTSHFQPEALERTRALLGYVGTVNPQTKFIIYTRGLATDLDRNAWLLDTEERFPALKGRVRILHVPGGDQATFRDPATRKLARDLVISVLGLQTK